MARNPLVARRRLGAVLRDLRTSSHLKIEDAARVLDCSGAKVSRLETGKGVPRQRDVRDLIEFYGAAARARRDELLGLVADSLSDGEGLVTDFRDVLDSDMVSDDQARYMALEQDAAALSQFQSGLVPGLLQTEAYAAAVAGMFFPDRDAAQRKRFVQLRMERRAVLRRPGDDRLKLSVVLGEPVFRRPVGGIPVLREQLAHLLDTARDGLSFVDFRVAPLPLVTPAVLGGPFSIIEFATPHDQDVVYLEGAESATYLETDEQVARYKDKFTALAAACPDRDRSIAIVEEVAESLT